MSTVPSAEEKPSRITVIDIGKQRRGRVNGLRRGKGPLMGKVEELLAEMKSAGEIDPNAQTVVLVVEKKRKKKKLFGTSW